MSMKRSPKSNQTPPPDQVQVKATTQSATPVPANPPSEATQPSQGLLAEFAPERRPTGSRAVKDKQSSLDLSSQDGADMRIDSGGKGIEYALSAVNSEVRQALTHSHEVLIGLGIPHVLIGGLAVGAHGYAYATRDVDYLVPEAAAFEGKLVITFKPGVPIKVGKVAIDYLVPEGPENVQRRMQECIAKAIETPNEVTYVPSDLLAYMKLKAGRAKDIGAVVELLKTGMDVEDTRAFLSIAGNPDVIARYEKCVRMAESEDES